ncbi:sodium:solute symporter [Dyadobacter chenhuakuii]|uniref:Sodium:solute symporter n=1 Tax=Dyadobacter chenhuakuii TaxID=2909339 RepID=A0A9X1QG93_9BACT|nr:sodium:solute symporter [Dyadobacter chenhuakuii]MCF2493566.1 sodium:solute symporter [Dyadobacter chenhuakuii]MCF2500926.1 sodium:solute symporter [Dyadobacter chenhuakuii]USJ30704.1 sodium:solute symporter [Dyadobacter chenhuakuii]
MNPYISLAILVAYFGMLITVSIYTSRGADTNTFFTANRQSPWYLVAFGMIGTSLSGVTFVSVPGAVVNIQFSYFQVVIGYILGYLVIGTVLMPLYYRLNLISIYSYLEQRFGFWSYKTGSGFFLLSRTVGSAVRLYVAAQVLQLALFKPLGIPFEVAVAITIFLIWIYTFKGGVKTIIVTDTLQTFFLITAVILTIMLVSSELNLDGFGDIWNRVQTSGYSKIFYWDTNDPKNFFKQFFAGVFIAIVMTGLDQDLMQKNLTCKNIGEAQKNMFWFTIVLVIVNFLFLSLGALLYVYAEAQGIPAPAKSDDFYPMLALNHLGLVVGITFLLGITAATYASSDSALTALTTAFCIDFMNIEKRPEEQRSTIKFWVHVGFSVVFYLVILIFNKLNSKEVITAVFDLAGYTYGPLLGLFSFGAFLKRPVKDKWVPLVCILAPIITYIINDHSAEWFNGYKFGFERLIINGLITFIGLWLLHDPKAKRYTPNPLVR